MIRVLMGFEPSNKLDMVNKVWVVDDWRGYNIHFMRLLPSIYAIIIYDGKPLWTNP